MKKPIITFTITAMAAAMALNGFAGDQAAQFEAKASLKQATGVATDAQGNVYVADGPAYTIRKYSPEGKYLCDVKDPVNVTPTLPSQLPSTNETVSSILATLGIQITRTINLKKRRQPAMVNTSLCISVLQETGR